MTERRTNTNPEERRGPRCPSCGRPRVHAYRPFCSARCRDADLGRWFSGAYAIPAVEDEADPDELAGLADRRPDD